MPYGKRYTTPTTVGETEGSLVVGYWVATRKVVEGVAVRLCERHMAVVTALDAQEEARAKAEEAARIAAEQKKLLEPKLDDHFQQRVTEVSQRKEQVIASTPAAPPPAPFKLGPGPLNNGNATAEQPPLPVPLDMTQLYQAGQLPGQQVVQPTLPLKNPNLPQAPVQGAALIDAPCLFCKVMVRVGEVHNCPQAGATSGINPIG